MLAWACGPATEQWTQDDDGDVSPPSCASCPLARTPILRVGGA